MNQAEQMRQSVIEHQRSKARVTAVASGTGVGSFCKGLIEEIESEALPGAEALGNELGRIALNGKTENVRLKAIDTAAKYLAQNDENNKDTNRYAELDDETLESILRGVNVEHFADPQNFELFEQLYEDVRAEYERKQQVRTIPIESNE